MVRKEVVVKKTKREPMTFGEKVAVVCGLLLIIGLCAFFVYTVDKDGKRINAENERRGEFCTPIAEKACLEFGYTLIEIKCVRWKDTCTIECIDENQVIIDQREIVCKNET